MDVVLVQRLTLVSLVYQGDRKVPASSFPPFSLIILRYDCSVKVENDHKKTEDCGSNPLLCFLQFLAVYCTSWT